MKEEQDLAKEINDDKHRRLSESWATIVKNLSMSHSQRFINSIREKTTNQINSADTAYHHFVDAAKYLSLKGQVSICIIGPYPLTKYDALLYSSHDPLLKQVKDYLREKVEKYGILPVHYDDFDGVLPSTLENGRFLAIKDVVNDEVASFLKALLDSYVSMLIVLEEKTKKERLGK